MEDGSSGRHGGCAGLPAHSLGPLPVQPAEGFCGRVRAPGWGQASCCPPGRCRQALRGTGWGVPRQPRGLEETSQITQNLRLATVCFASGKCYSITSKIIRANPGHFW